MHRSEIIGIHAVTGNPCVVRLLTPPPLCLALGSLTLTVAHRQPLGSAICLLCPLFMSLLTYQDTITSVLMVGNQWIWILHSSFVNKESFQTDYSAVHMGHFADSLFNSGKYTSTIYYKMVLHKPFTSPVSILLFFYRCDLPMDL